MSNSTGAAGQPLYDDSYGFDLAADLNEVSNYAAGLALNGSWTPTLGGGGGATMGTSSTTAGTFSRIGNQGQFVGSMLFGGGCSFGTNTAAILGFPFNLAAASAAGTGLYQKTSSGSPSGLPIPVFLAPSSLPSTPGVFIYALSGGALTALKNVVTPTQSDYLSFVVNGYAG